MRIRRFKRRDRITAQRLNDMVDALNDLATIRGDGFVEAQHIRGSGYALSLNVPKLLPEIPKLRRNWFWARAVDGREFGLPDAYKCTGAGLAKRGYAIYVDEVCNPEADSESTYQTIVPSHTRNAEGDYIPKTAAIYWPTTTPGNSFLPFPLWSTPGFKHGFDLIKVYLSPHPYLGGGDAIDYTIRPEFPIFMHAWCRVTTIAVTAPTLVEWTGSSGGDFLGIYFDRVYQPGTGIVSDTWYPHAEVNHIINVGLYRNASVIYGIDLTSRIQLELGDRTEHGGGSNVRTDTADVCGWPPWVPV